MIVRVIVFVLPFLTCYYSASGKNVHKEDDIRFSLDPLYSNNNETFQPLNYCSQHKTHGAVRIQCFQYRNGDSARLYDISFTERTFKKGTHGLHLNLAKNDHLEAIDYSFIEVLNKFKQMPPGSYVTHISITISDSISAHKTFYWAIDSTLSGNSPLKTSIDDNLLGNQKHLIGDIAPINAGTVQRQLSKNSKKLSREVARSSGATTTEVVRNNEHYSALFYKSWFVGYYKIDADNKLKSRILTEKNLDDMDPLSTMPSANNAVSLDSKVRQRNLHGKKEDDIEGNIDVSGNMSTGQESTSQQQNNFGEVRADLHTRVLNMPVELEGYYTTQDLGRQAKASFIRLRYDADKAKGDLNRSIGGYQDKFSETGSQIANAKTMYSKAIQTLKGEQSLIKRQFSKEYGVTPGSLSSSEGNTDKLISTLSAKQVITKNIGRSASDSDVLAAKVKLNKNRADVMRKYQKMVELQKKIDRYESMTKQIQEQRYFDSTLTYSKLSSLNSNPNSSYKQLARAGSNILPPGKATSFLAGLTKFEAGSLNTYESNYTLAGQTLKGAKVGYDFGFVEASVSAGRTEYISREGNVDKYNSYMGRLDFKSVQNQKFGLIYFGYSPTKQIIESNNFIKSDVGVSSFIQPVHIISLTYSGLIAKQLLVETEAATSIRKSGFIRKVDWDNSTIKTAVTYNIDKINTSVKGEWEHMGRMFENNSLPYIASGTERYTLSAKTNLFKSLVTTGVQFNYMQQAAFASRGYSTRWGFDVKTNFRTYPNIFLSYKPFSTFRRYDDTLSIPQRPVSGSVAIARATYQWRKGPVSQRVLLMYNQNTSNADSLSYHSRTIQAGYYYLSKINTLFLNAGWVKQPAPLSKTLSSTWFFGPNFSRAINENTNVNVGADIAFSAHEIMHFGVTSGVMYRFERKPIRVRAQIRYSNLAVAGQTVHNNLLALQLGANWLIASNKAHANLQKSNR